MTIVTILVMFGFYFFRRPNEAVLRQWGSGRVPLEVCPLSHNIRELGVMVTLSSSCHPEPAALSSGLGWNWALLSQGSLEKDKQRWKAGVAWWDSHCRLLSVLPELCWSWACWLVGPDSPDGTWWGGMVLENGGIWGRCSVSHYRNELLVCALCLRDALKWKKYLVVRSLKRRVARPLA